MQTIVYKKSGTILRTCIRRLIQHTNQPEYFKNKLREHFDICGHLQYLVFPFYKLMDK